VFKRLCHELVCYSYQCPAILRAKISELNYIGTELCLWLDITMFMSTPQRQQTEVDKRQWVRLWPSWTQAGLQLSPPNLWLSY